MQKKEVKFLEAAKKNDILSMSKILQKKDKTKAKGKVKDYFNINVKNSDGVTAIHYAARNGNIKMIEVLLSNGAIIDVTDKIYWRPISYAIAHNKIDTVTRLIDNGSKINVPNEMNSPIHLASALGHKDIVKILMDKGANIHCQNEKHQTPVDVACESNHYGVVNMLLSGSSNQIEEFSKKNFKNVTRKCLLPSFKKTSLPIALSNNNITSMTLNSPHYLIEDSLNIFNNRSVGSQEHISNTSRYMLKSFKSNPSKSESLNTIFINGDESKKYVKETKDHFFENNRNIILPYPSKFSTSEQLKVKSMLSFRNSQSNDDNVFLKDTVKVSEIETTMTDDKSINLKEEYDKQDKKNFDKNSQFVLPQTSLQTIQPKIKNILPLDKQKFEYNSHFDIEEIREYGLYKDKLYQYSERETLSINPIYERSSSQLKENTTPSKRFFINSSSVDNVDISCYTWIQSIDLLMIWETLVNEGFNSFLSLSLATDEEMLILCNNRIDHLNTLETKLNNLNIPPINQLILSSDIQQILVQLGLDQYRSSFIQEGYFYVHQLPKITEKLMTHLGITKIGHRRLLTECFAFLVHNRPNVKGKCGYNYSVTNLPYQSSSHSSMLVHQYNVSTKIKCTSLPRCNVDGTSICKKLPPPVPPRSSSISNENYIKPKTLDDLIMKSMNEEKLRHKNTNCCSSKKCVANSTDLDEIMTMLANLSKELD